MCTKVNATFSRIIPFDVVNKSIMSTLVSYYKITGDELKKLCADVCTIVIRRQLECGNIDSEPSDVYSKVTWAPARIELRMLLRKRNLPYIDNCFIFITSDIKNVLSPYYTDGTHTLFHDIGDVAELEISFIETMGRTNLQLRIPGFWDHGYRSTRQSKARDWATKNLYKVIRAVGIVTYFKIIRLCGLGSANVIIKIALKKEILLHSVITDDVTDLVIQTIKTSLLEEVKELIGA